MHMKRASFCGDVSDYTCRHADPIRDNVGNEQDAIHEQMEARGASADGPVHALCIVRPKLTIATPSS